jgi:hypothetical protein
VYSNDAASCDGVAVLNNPSQDVIEREGGESWAAVTGSSEM